ncbi:uncharacterized protein NECHADRAFT_86839 [Fusarium vanettenii 77-13-4]|uniref:Uncharacterized protein n=1 Tax=Fusarium vanettenii (strain ATCC MYA-4622 / CBS 123669 / FGSC 9596 / NRRL 45880 / 77-13-4) TaxID=660122 RepID=C7ZK79_FUSV7|nr:uncharacterized protein NECHADRAFT_86839 [Fusarium vanettenii 77-13-4]EEU35630.1 predicted protein [Fusarium vanettenii 77-13-4]
MKKDKNNCGACRNVCKKYQSCDQGSCVCSAGLTTCGDACKNLLTDKKNYGSCGNICSGGSICSAGSCVCPNGKTLCSDGCYNLNTDSSSCGVCKLQAEPLVLEAPVSALVALKTNSAVANAPTSILILGTVGDVSTTITIGIVGVVAKRVQEGPLVLEAAASVLPTKSSAVLRACLLIATR